MKRRSKVVTTRRNSSIELVDAILDILRFIDKRAIDGREEDVVRTALERFRIALGEPTYQLFLVDGDLIVPASENLDPALLQRTRRFWISHAKRRRKSAFVTTISERSIGFEIGRASC